MKITLITKEQPTPRAADVKPGQVYIGKDGLRCLRTTSGYVSLDTFRYSRQEAHPQHFDSQVRVLDVELIITE
jgi:hypothetical protein